MSYCECDWDADEWPKWYRSVIIKCARKKHQCCECNGPILIGESYRMELEKWAKISVPCFTNCTFGELHERVREMVSDVAPKVPGFMFEWGRRMVRIKERGRK